jgi:hypothetical protein
VTEHARAEIAAVLECDASVERRARYVLDTLCMAADLRIRYVDRPPQGRPWLHYAARSVARSRDPACVQVTFDPAAWDRCDRAEAPDRTATCVDVRVPYPMADEANGASPDHIGFDLPANAFFFLASLWERRRGTHGDGRALYAESVFATCAFPQDIVDRYLDLLLQHADRAIAAAGLPDRGRPRWPGGAGYAVVLSHDVDYVPRGATDVALQGARTFLRHLVRQRRARDAFRSAAGFLRGVIAGRDVYGCLPEIVERERALGVRASYQIAVANRHPADVTYRVEDPAVRAYLGCLTEDVADVCLHGSVRSTERTEWYEEEAALLGRCLRTPFGSRQHYLAFDYENLFRAQERAGIRYDMSIGYPDRTGSRSGFSYPFFPYSLAEERPFDVVEIGLFLMDVTLQSYMDLDAEEARPTTDRCLADLATRGGCASIVWHPIVFGGARDPGYGDLFWRIVDTVAASGGVATDGRPVDGWWRARAAGYGSFGASASASACLPERSGRGSGVAGDG